MQRPERPSSIAGEMEAIFQGTGLHGRDWDGDFGRHDALPATLVSPSRQHRRWPWVAAAGGVVTAGLALGIGLSVSGRVAVDSLLHSRPAEAVRVAKAPERMASMVAVPIEEATLPPGTRLHDVPATRTDDVPVTQTASAASETAPAARTSTPLSRAQAERPRRKPLQLVLNRDRGADDADGDEALARNCDSLPDGAASRCWYGKVLASDRRLARRYRLAARSGVPVAELKYIRREWMRAQHWSQRDPAGTIRAFDELAYGLGLLTNETNTAQYRSPESLLPPP